MHGLTLTSLEVAVAWFWILVFLVTFRAIQIGSILHEVFNFCCNFCRDGFAKGCTCKRVRFVLFFFVFFFFQFLNFIQQMVNLLFVHFGSVVLLGRWFRLFG